MTIIRTEATNKILSPNGGLLIYQRLAGQLSLEKRLKHVLPELEGRGKASQYRKVENLLMSFVLGADCLDDVGYFATDAAFRAVCPVRYAPNSLGEFLRSFEKQNCINLRRSLLDLTISLRKALRPDEKRFVLSLDSTKHEHCGEKIEGLQWTHDGKWCLDSLQAYDELGLQYFFDLRSGATHTSQGAVEAFTEVFNAVKRRDHKQKLILLGDSGYCNYDVFNGCFHAGAKFVISLRQQIYNKYAEQIQNWRPTKLKSHDGRDCEIGSTVFFKEGTLEPVRIVALRARIEGLLEAYDVFDFITNIGVHEMNNEAIVKLYRKRSNCENFIKSTKNDLDLKHFPCQKLLANTAYGLIGTIAHNLMRFTALVEDPFHPKFAKLLRFRMVKLACEVVTHARTVTFRFMKHHMEDIHYWIEKIYITLNSVGVLLLE